VDFKLEFLESRIEFLSSVFSKSVLNWRPMNTGQSVWDRLFRLVLALLVVAGMLGICLWYKPVIDANQRARRYKLELDRKIELETETARKLDTSLRSMRNPATVERLARERLSYAKPGETVIHFDLPGDK
jgi:cell division protein FtsB